MGPGLAPGPPVKRVSMDGRGGSVIVGLGAVTLPESSLFAILSLSLFLFVCLYAKYFLVKALSLSLF